MHLHFLIKIVFYLLFSYIGITQSYANNDTQSINVLTWWGYLNYPEIVSNAENKCGVKISFDQYYSNDEFLRRWEGQKELYDIVIFSDTIYNIAKNKLPKFNSDLWLQSQAYHPIIKKHYQGKHYPHNIVYFFQALTGFLWNPANISLSTQNSVSEIFNKAANKYAVIIDDPVEAWKLTEAGLLDQGKSARFSDFNMKNFHALIRKSEVYITNNYTQISKNPNFAFSFSWSGESIVDVLGSNKEYRFLIHPKLSYISSDLLAQTSDNAKTACVAKFLTNPTNMAYLQNKDFYFSPYKQTYPIQNKDFQRLYSDYLKNLPSLLWVDSIDENSFASLNQAWQLIKISMNNRSRGD